MTAAKAAGAGVVAFACTIAATLVVVLLVLTQAPPENPCATPAQTAPVPGTAVPAQGPVGNGVEVAARAALRAGWSHEDAVTAVAVAGAESGWNRLAANSTSTARGMWQIMLFYHQPKFHGADWRNPYANAKVAHQIWQESGWTPWVTYTTGAFRDHLEEARAAVAKVTGGHQSAIISAASTPDSAATKGLRPVAKRAVAVVRAKFGFKGTIGGYANRNIGSTNQLSKHALGLAIDVMVSAADNKALGDRIAGYFAGPAARPLAVDNVIWNRRITNAGRGWQWGTYNVPAGGSPHTDHVHIDFHDVAVTDVSLPAVQAGEETAPAAECTTDQAAQAAQPVVAAGGPVVYPVRGGKSLDRHNYGGSGSHWAHGHTGTDFSVGCGTPVLAATRGTVVIETGPSWYGRWLVKVSQGPHALTTWYAHMQEVTVRAGQAVQPGQQIGEVGTLGNSTGCHLHFEVHPKNGSIYEDGIDPSPWLTSRTNHPLALAEAQ